jgi:hypothetical protein
MRREALKRLLDAFEAIEAIERFIENCTLDHYLDNELIQSAVERKFEIIGEALKRALEADPSVLAIIPDLRRIVMYPLSPATAYDVSRVLLLAREIQGFCEDDENNWRSATLPFIGLGFADSMSHEGERIWFVAEW